MELSAATELDVDRITDLHLASFDSNVLLHVQFPTKASLDGLHSFLRHETLCTIQNIHNTEKIVLVVRDTETDQIISFAKWDLPSLSTGHAHAGVTWPDGCRQEYLESYYEKAEAAKKRAIGNRPCYRLTFVGTHPKFQGRGAGTLLTEWGLSRAKKDKVPVYLESTIGASSMYLRLGFIAVDGFSMILPGNGENHDPTIYQELSMVRMWDDDEMDHWDSSLNISSLTLDYEAGIKPQQVVLAVYDRIDAYKEVQPSVWIHLQPSADVMQAANEIYRRWPDAKNRPPLWGIPFSVKDSINVAGIPTTIGCSALMFTPDSSAPVFQHCIDAGGLFIGKTNMEQLATGMTGCRSPYGTLHSTFSKSHIVGGSSSGSAVTVSEGLVSFSLGSDTAGSIRVPALYNGIVGFKPTKGTVSARGVAPACLHQDCVSFLAASTQDVERVWRVCEGFDKEDPFAKLPIPASLNRRQRTREPTTAHKSPNFRFGIPPHSALEVCSPAYRRQFAQVVKTISSAGGKLVDLNWTPFAEANELLYNSSFVLERLTILPDGWFENNKQLLHPVTRAVFEGALARQSTAVDVFKDLHKQAEYKRVVEDILTFDNNTEELTVMVVPTAPFHPTIEEVGKDPVGLNGRLGAFAHFANVLDLTGVAMACGTYEIESKEGNETRLPFGVTILAGTRLDEELLRLVKDVEEVLRDVGQDE